MGRGQNGEPYPKAWHYTGARDYGRNHLRIHGPSDAWLEGPYQDARAQDDLIEHYEEHHLEDLYNDLVADGEIASDSHHYRRTGETVPISFSEWAADEDNWVSYFETWASERGRV